MAIFDKDSAREFARRIPNTKCDLQFWNHGSFVQCTPMTDAGREWMFNNLMGGMPGIEEAIPDCMWPVYIEHRYLTDIVEGARADGLICEG